MQPIAVRDAEAEDLQGLLEIYNDVIRTSTAVFGDEPVTLEERGAWVEARRAQGYPVLVATDEQGVPGFGSFGGSAPGPAIARPWSTPCTSVRTAAGGGRYGDLRVLIERAAALDKHAMIAAVEAVNAAWVRLHERSGSSRWRAYRRSRASRRWLDLVLLELIIR